MLLPDLPLCKHPRKFQRIIQIALSKFLQTTFRNLYPKATIWLHGKPKSRNHRSKRIHWTTLSMLQFHCLRKIVLKKPKSYAWKVNPNN